MRVTMRALSLPGSPRAGLYFARKAEALRKAGDSVTAKGQLQVASEISSDSYEIWKGLAEVYAFFGEMDKSAEAWHQASQRVPTSSPEYWWAKAYEAHRRGNVDDAVHSFEQGAENFAGDWSRRFLESAGEILHGVGRLEEAKQMYLRVIRLAPHWIYPHLYIAEIEISLGHPDLASEWYAKAVDIDPTNAEACGYLRAIPKRTDNPLVLLTVQKCHQR